MDGLGLRQVYSGVVFPFVIDGGETTEVRVSAGRIVEAFDELEDSHPGELSQLIRRRTRLRAARPVIEKAIRACCIEAMTQSHRVWRPIPPILAASPHS